MPRPLKEITLPKSQHKVFIAESIKYGEQLQLDGILYESMEIENAKDQPEKETKKGKKKASTDPGMNYRMNGAVMVQLLREKMLLLVKKIVLAEDVVGFGSKGQEIAITDDFIDELEVADGVFLGKEIEAVLEAQKKSS